MWFSLEASTKKNITSRTTQSKVPDHGDFKPHYWSRICDNQNRQVRHAQLSDFHPFYSVSLRASSGFTRNGNILTPGLSHNNPSSRFGTWQYFFLFFFTNLSFRDYSVLVLFCQEYLSTCGSSGKGIRIPHISSAKQEHIWITFMEAKKFFTSILKGFMAYSWSDTACRGNGVVGDPPLLFANIVRSPRNSPQPEASRTSFLRQVRVRKPRMSAITSLHFPFSMFHRKQSS